MDLEESRIVYKKDVPF
ncbi:Protein of unknown function [Bacillus mycoides]|uniref:Uncharacterized protein n=1 Tax=Bacillus mycoides TaxID=1405 RepID=A0A1D3MN80_BACMY|nr:Protein of unknown function [Bacillus mycoides]SCM87415.1 Protein of unknown function [Bacillus mycoides]